MDSPPVLYEVKDRIATVTLNRPQSLNAFNRAMQAALRDVWIQVRDDDEVLVAVLTGAGRAFCAGLDVKETASDLGSADDVDHDPYAPGRPYSEREHAEGMTIKMSRVYKPLICAVNGVAAGGGMRFIAESDVVISVDDAEFFDSHVTAGHASTVLPILMTRGGIPYNVAMRFALVGNKERLSAQRAYQLGLVTELVPADKLLERAYEIARMITANAPIAVRKSVEGTWKGLDNGLAGALEYGNVLFQEVWATKDFQEGNQAFAERREPNFTGR